MKLALAVLSLGLGTSLGCNQIGDINDPIPKDSVSSPGSGTAQPPGTTPGTETPAGSTDHSRFVGTWSGSGSITFKNCTDSAYDGTFSGQGKLSFAESPSGLRLEDSLGCGGAVKVDGNVATQIAVSTCTDTTTGEQHSVTVNARSFTLTSSMSATLSLTGTQRSEQATCEFTQDGQFTKG